MSARSVSIETWLYLVNDDPEPVMHVVLDEEARTVCGEYNLCGAVLVVPSTRQGIQCNLGAHLDGEHTALVYGPDAASLRVEWGSGVDLRVTDRRP